jgi:long-chain acyl-CoA synthetase
VTSHTPLDFLRATFREHASEEAIAHGDTSRDFAWLLAAWDAAGEALARAGVGSGAVVALEADYSPASIAHLLALLDGGAIVVPIAPSSAGMRDVMIRIAAAEWRVTVGPGDAVAIVRTGVMAAHPLIERLRAQRHPGLVLFTSGSSGEPKGVVHDATRLLAKYRVRRHRLRTLMFLLFDHIGGVDSLLQALGNACAVVIPEDRTPEGVSAAVARHRAEVLPAAPSFLALLLLSEAHTRHDLSSLRYITYGAEAMPGATLARLAAEFPNVTLMQKYGLTELGTLRSRSRANDSLWVKIGGEGYETRVVDGLLQIRATSSMLGYLNAASPFTDDGWFMTGDAVEVEGEWLRILGRDSDLINVAGRKVYPAEVESVVHEVENVAEAAVRGEAHPFTGQIVVARVRPASPEDPRALERRVREHCRARLAPYKVPVKIEVTEAPLHTERHKTTRR